MTITLKKMIPDFFNLCSGKFNMIPTIPTGRWFLLGVVLMVQPSWVLAQGVFTTPSEREYPNGSMLISPDFLTNELEKIIVLDVRSEDAYKKGHVPTAIRIDHDEWQKEFGNGTDAKAWSERISALGIDGKKPVVVYDDSMAENASRIWWILRYWNVPDVKILNGCWRDYLNSKQPVSREPVTPKPAKFSAEKQPGRVANHSDLVTIISRFKGKWQVIDSRTSDEFSGKDKRDAKKGGHIPSAKNIEWTMFLDKGSERFKTAEQLKKLLKDNNIDLSKPLVVYSHEGGRASVVVFALELLGARDVICYYDGWKKWSENADGPVSIEN